MDYLHQHGYISNQEICDMLHVSKDTARRDIIKIVDEGAAVRTHGGISSPQITKEIKAYKERISAASMEKLAISKVASRHVQDGDICFLDVSTTIKLLCEQLNQNELTLYTHSLDNAEILSYKKGSSIYLLGGKFNPDNRYFFDWTMMTTQLDTIYFDKAFFGAAGIREDGIYFVDKDDAHFKRMVAKRAKQVFVLMDTQKFHQTSMYKGLAFDEIDKIITDAYPPNGMTELLNTYHIDLEIAAKKNML